MNRRAIFVLLLVAFIDSLGLGLVYPTFSFLLFHPSHQLVDPSTSDSVRGLWLGVLLSTMPVSQMIFSPFVGRLSDTFGRRLVILVCLLFGCLGYLLAAYFVWSRWLFGLIASRVLVGLSTSSIGVINASIADVAGEGKRGKYFAWINTAFGLGFGLGPMVGVALSEMTFIGSQEALRPFLGTCGLTFINAVLAWFWLRETKVPSPSSPSVKWSKLIREIVSVEKKVAFILFATFLFCSAWSFYSEFVPVWWVKVLHLSTLEVAVFYSYGCFWYVITCVFIVGPLLERVRPIFVLEKGMLVLMMLGWIVFSFGQFISTFWLIMPLQNITAACLFPVAATVLSEMTPQANQGRVMGLHAAFESLGWGVSPVLGGLCIGIHLLAPVFVGSFAAFVAFLLVRRARRQVALEQIQR
jgi:MFS family permease